MTTLTQTQSGLETRLRTIAGLEVSGYAPDAATPPAAIVQLPTAEQYRIDLAEDTFNPTWEIVVVVTAEHPQAQLDLLPYLDRTGTKSVFAAINGDRSLGGLDVDANVLSARQLGKVEIAGTVYYGAAVTVQVLVGNG